MKRSAIFVVIGIIALAFLLMGFVGQKEKINDPNTSLEKRISALEAEIAELKAELQSSHRLQPTKANKKGSVSERPGPSPKPLVWTEGQRGWDEDGTNIWTSNLSYKVGIGTATPGFNLDINGDIRITGGINDGTSFGAANNVLVADGVGGVQWGSSPAGSGDYIWNQDTTAQTPGNFWIAGSGQAGDGVGVTGALHLTNAGVYGQSNDNTGAGVFGDGLTATSGVYGQTNINTGFGVYGYQAASGGCGIFGVAMVLLQQHIIKVQVYLDVVMLSLLEPMPMQQQGQKGYTQEVLQQTGSE